MTKERMEELLNMANVRHLKASELRELAMQIEQYEKKENSFIDYCKNHIEEKIYGFVGQSFYGCDLSHELTMEENCNGKLQKTRPQERRQKRNAEKPGDRTACKGQDHHH